MEINIKGWFELLNEVYGWLEDDLSREIYRAKLFHILGEDSGIQCSGLCKKSCVKLETAERFIDEIVNSGGPLIIYGVGLRCLEVLNFCKYLDVKLEIILCDSDYERIHEKYGKKIYEPMNVVMQYPNSKIMITPRDAYEEIVTNLCNNGVAKSRLCSWDDSEQMWMQYFDPLISFDSNEIFADVGVLDGMTSVRFAEKCSRQYQKIYMFEAETNKKSDIQTTIQAYKLYNVELHMKGLWDCKDVLSFSGKLGGKSIITDVGNMTVEVDTLDHILEGRPITFLKMDIEGAELKALKGAKETIQTHKPKLAICIYHKPEDILEIPAYIKKLVPEYKLYIRHYSFRNSETVLYALP